MRRIKRNIFEKRAGEKGRSMVIKTYKILALLLGVPQSPFPTVMYDETAPGETLGPRLGE